MTTINVTDVMGHYIIDAEGHTGFGSLGNDILCSAVSVIIQSLLGYAEEKQLLCSYDISEGKIKMIIKKDGRIDYSAGVCIYGLKVLSEQYPSNIKIKIDKEIKI